MRGELEDVDWEGKGQVFGLTGYAAWLGLGLMMAG